MPSTTDEIFDELLRGVNEQEVNRIKGILWRGAATQLARDRGETCAPLFESIAREIMAQEKDLEKQVPPGVLQDAVEEFRNEARDIFR